MSTDTLCDRFRSWFDYEARAHEKVLRSLHSVPASHRDAPEFQKALELVGHIVAARWLWLNRFGVAESGPTTLFPEDVALEELDSLVDEMHIAWTAYLGWMRPSSRASSTIRAWRGRGIEIPLRIC